MLKNNKDNTFEIRLCEDIMDGTGGNIEERERVRLNLDYIRFDHFHHSFTTSGLTTRYNSDEVNILYMYIYIFTIPHTHICFFMSGR